MKIIHVQTQIDIQSFLTYLSLDGFFNRKRLRGQGDQEMGYSGKRRSSQNLCPPRQSGSPGSVFLQEFNWSEDLGLDSEDER